MRARVYVTLKEGVLDPAGQAVLHGLHALGFAELRDARLGRFIELDLDDGPDAEARVRRMCETLLANPVMEEFRIELDKA
jgi:phosphoribosylformylglycinamidine synthase